MSYFAESSVGVADAERHRDAARGTLVRRVLRWLVVVILVLHGLIHLLGAAKGFGLADVTALKEPIGPALGAAWLAAGTLVVVAAVLLAIGFRWWWVVGAVAVVVSQAVILTSWNDAKVGSVANAILLLAVVYRYLSQGPTSAPTRIPASLSNMVQEQAQEGARSAS